MFRLLHISLPRKEPTMRRPIKRVTLWKKQRQFLDFCLEAKMTVSQVLTELGIPHKMFMLWLSKPAFKQRFKKVEHCLQKRRDLDLLIGATDGAALLNELQLKKSKPNAKKEQRSTEIVKL